MTQVKEASSELREETRNRSELAALVEAWFGIDRPGSLAATFPQVFHPLGRSGLFYLNENGKPVCHAAVCEVRLRTQEKVENIALVGAVATAPESRGRGLASRLLDQVAEREQQRGRDALVLWSDRWSFYERLGFSPVGRQWEATLTSSSGEADPDIRPARVGDLPEILRFHQAKPVAVERGLDDLALLLSTAPMTTMVLERGEGIAAYACLGKGIDFPGWWHEVGGADSDIARLISGAMQELGLSSSTLLVPPYRPELLELLAPNITSLREGVAGLAKPLLGQTENSFLDGLDSI